MKRLKKMFTIAFRIILSLIYFSILFYQYSDLACTNNQIKFYEQPNVNDPEYAQQIINEFNQKSPCPLCGEYYAQFGYKHFSIECTHSQNKIKTFFKALQRQLILSF